VSPVALLAQGCVLSKHSQGHHCQVEQQLLAFTRLQSSQCKTLCLEFQMFPEKYEPNIYI